METPDAVYAVNFLPLAPAECPSRHFPVRNASSKIESILSGPASPAKSASYKLGDRVFHRKFGEGTVIAVEVEGDDELVQVAFPEQGIKKLSASVAPLEKR